MTLQGILIFIKNTSTSYGIIGNSETEEEINTKNFKLNKESMSLTGSLWKLTEIIQCMK